ARVFPCRGSWRATARRRAFVETAGQSYANRVSGRPFPRSGETVFWPPETKGPELPLRRCFFPAETASRLCAPTKPRVFVKPREISVGVGLHGRGSSLLRTRLPWQNNGEPV